jgi:hypothetical protein
MNTDTWADRNDFEASALEVREDTCACDMRHPDDDSPFTHHPYCIVGHAAKPAYTNNLTWTPDNLGLKTIKVTDDDEMVVVTAMGGTQLVCTACEAPFTIDQWLLRVWRDNGDLYHEECDTSD